MKKQDVMDAVTNNSLDLIKKPGKSKIVFILGGGEIRTRTIPIAEDYCDNYFILHDASWGYSSAFETFKTIILEYDKIIGIAFD